MMTSSLTPDNNANQSYVAFLNLQTGKIISYLRSNISFFICKFLKLFCIYEILFHFYEKIFRFYEIVFR